MAITIVDPIFDLDRAGVPFRVTIFDDGEMDLHVREFSFESNDEFIFDGDYIVSVVDIDDDVLDSEFIFRSNHGKETMSYALRVACDLHAMYPEHTIHVDRD